MNNDRRKEIHSTIDDVEKTLKPLAEAAIKAKEAADEALRAFQEAALDIVGEIEHSRDGEQEYLDNMPENMQQGEKGQNAEQAISDMDEAISALDEQDSIEDYDLDAVVSSLDDAAGG